MDFTIPLTFHLDKCVLKQNSVVLLFLFPAHIRFQNQQLMRKTLLFLFACLFINSFVQAQIKKGTILLGGNISASSSKTETSTTIPSEQKSRGINISPSLGFTIKENLILGGGVNYGYSSSTEQSFKRTNNNYGANLFLRKYLTLEKGFYLFGEGSAFVNKANTEDKNSGTISSSNKFLTVGLNFNPGVSYAVNNRFHLEVGLNNLGYISYQKQKYTSGSNTSKTNSFSLGSNLSGSSPLSVGFRFLLGK
jgi:hypothetical protein